MARLTRYIFGAAARCSDGPCGEVSRVMMDPATWTVTHLIIEPDDPHQLGRLVSLDLLGTTPGEISLRCTATEFFQLPRAESTQSPPRTGEPGVYRLGGQSGRQVIGPLGFAVKAPGPETFTYDVLPTGKVAVHGGDPVCALDGDIGHIIGVVIDAGSRHVAYLLLHAGHQPIAVAGRRCQHQIGRRASRLR
ncbi:MAG: hypothetical protein ACRDOB_28900 [Streptosporangiaceae bacterium]